MQRLRTETLSSFPPGPQRCSNSLMLLTQVNCLNPTASQAKRINSWA